MVSILQLERGIDDRQTGNPHRLAWQFEYFVLLLSRLLVIVIKESGAGSVSVRSQLQDADARYGREIAIIREKAGAAGR